MPAHCELCKREAHYTPERGVPAPLLRQPQPDKVVVYAEVLRTQVDAGVLPAGEERGESYAEALA